jgi:murein DD-endopeptidase MepM/ murein hydrolase activator NlpD
MLKSFLRLAMAAVLLPFAIALAALVGLAFFRIGPSPQIEIQPDRPGIGPRTVVVVRVKEPERGVGRVTVTVTQDGKDQLLATNDQRGYRPRAFWAFWGDVHAEDELEVTLGREATPGLEAGTATLRVAAERAGTWLRRPEPAVAELALPVRHTPPALEKLSGQVYLAQGGSEIVVYRVGEETSRDGVQAGDWFFPGHPLPGGSAGERAALFAMPYDLADPAQVSLVAEDELGNRASAPCVDKFFPKPFKKDTIPLDDAFMGKVVPEILAHTPEMKDKGDLLQNYLALNRDLRKINAERLREMAAGSRPEFLWRRVFLPVANAAVRSSFADRRTYVYKGQAVDQQDHLGFDMASVKQAPVQSVNDGVVALAEYFGIYGLTVVVDHGHGLMSLYGHLSKIAVKEGDRVERGQELGRTGETGLAGGDHLHFAMLLDGLAVNPVEWWDEHWIQDRIALKLGTAFPFEPTK